MKTDVECCDLGDTTSSCCSESDDLGFAEALMSRHKKSRIVCLDDQGKLAGVISLSDIARIETGARSSALLRSVSQSEARV